MPSVRGGVDNPHTWCGPLREPCSSTAERPPAPGSPPSLSSETKSTRSSCPISTPTTLEASPSSFWALSTRTRGTSPCGSPDLPTWKREFGRPRRHWAIRSNEQDWSFPILFQELPTGAAAETGPVAVRTFPTRHSPESHPRGIWIQAGTRSLVYSGDTGWFDELPSRVNGSDLFICECTQVQKSYEFHLSLEELAERKHEFDCGKHLLTHLGAEMRSLTDLNGFEVADDGLVLKL